MTVDFDNLARTIDAVSLQEKILTQILTLALEYEEKQITVQRFADRTMQILHGYGEAAKKLNEEK